MEDAGKDKWRYGFDLNPSRVRSLNLSNDLKGSKIMQVQLRSKARVEAHIRSIEALPDYLKGFEDVFDTPPTETIH